MCLTHYRVFKNQPDSTNKTNADKFVQQFEKIRAILIFFDDIINHSFCRPRSIISMIHSEPCLRQAAKMNTWKKRDNQIIFANGVKNNRTPPP